MSAPPLTGEGEGGGERLACPPILTFPRIGGKGTCGLPPSECPHVVWCDLVIEQGIYAKYHERDPHRPSAR
jgi:hypothetical protein